MTDDRTGPRAIALRHRRKRQQGVTFIGLAGELLITTGVVVFLFLGWQLWFNDLVVGADQNTVGSALGEGWNAAAPAQAPVHSHTAEQIDFGDPVVASAPGDTINFAVMYVPRFGADFARSISEGVETGKVLDKNGIGHYPKTQMPGQTGNFAVAAHRTTHGAPFKDIATLRVGDKIYVQTPDGYYTYEFRGLEYVRPTGVGVLNPVPQFAGVEPTDRILTMTSCNPMFSSAERIIAYAVLQSWQPTSAGSPAAIVAATSVKR